ncbi:MAG TPA: phosphatase PAP2 family protein [Gemmatimonadales bacterium]|jgi:undecaprenyl-diphosphatase|nr:phosphatase PAP2 family protein [Gemmatimonadales bacterium]
MTPTQRALLTRWRRLLASHWVILVVASISVALGLSKITREIFEGPRGGLGSLDASARAWVLAHRTPFGKQVLAALTLLGSTLATLILVSLLAFWLWRRKDHLVTAVFVSAPATAVLLLLGYREVMTRERPPGAAGIVANSSFPGGHVIVATSLWVTLMYLLWREKLLPLGPALLVAVVWPLLVAVSRIYLDVHWTSDVIAGWLLGLSLALAAAAVYERWRVTGGRLGRS